MSDFKPGSYYRNETYNLSEIRQLIGEPPPQGALFSKDLVLPDDRWKYRVVWSPNQSRIGQVSEVTPKTFKGWAQLDYNQDWWIRVDAGELVYNHELEFWLDKTTDEVVVTMDDRACDECGHWSVPDDGVRFPASDLRAFLGER